jgi:multidrug transporter EmrE-like cation transporter
MGSIPLGIIGTFIAAIAGQLIAIGLLPRTSGFTVPVPTFWCIAALVFGVWMNARIAQSGVSIGILIPFMSAVVPLATVVIGIVAYGEGASFPRLVVLAIACGLIGLASRLP